MINTILVEENQLCLELLSELCGQCSDLNPVHCFTCAESALKLADEQQLELAFISSTLRGTDAFELGLKLRETSRGCILIYVVASAEDCVKALKIKADYCLLKPYSFKDVFDCVNRASILLGYNRSPIQVNCFGRFSLSYNSTLVSFKSRKAKELFALCVDHCGADVTMEEAADKLWPHKPYDDKVKALYRHAVMNIRHTLRRYNIENVFLSTRGACRINPYSISCDYYKYQKDPLANIGLFCGEYMSDFPWAEEKAAALYFHKQSIMSSFVGSDKNKVQN